MDHAGIQVFGYGNRDQIERLIAAHQHKAAHQRRSHVVGVGGATGDFFALHGKLHQLNGLQRTAQQQVGPEHRCRRTCRAAANAAAGLYLFQEGDFKTLFAAQILQHGLQRHARRIFFGLQGHSRKFGLVLDCNARRIRFADQDFITRIVEGKTQNVESGGNVGNRGGGKNVQAVQRLNG